MSVTLEYVNEIRARIGMKPVSELPQKRERKIIVAMPRDQWPMWAKVLAQKSTPGDKGIGDVVARTIGPETSGAFKAFYEMTFGKPCGCKGRQNLWNIKYPLN